MSPLLLSARTESWPLRTPVRIARQTYVAMDVVVAEVRDTAGLVGRGEAAGLPYEGETMQSILDQLTDVASLLAASGALDARDLLPRGGARNALDCALWDLRAKQAKRRVWTLAGLPEATPVTTALTFGIGDDEPAYRRAISRARHMPIVKLKADRERHVRLAEIAREEHPAARLLIDANGSWGRELLDKVVAPLHRLGVELIEQPVAPGEDETLAGHAGPIPLAADESCTDRASLGGLRGLYRLVNIKLDKTGGLTEALALAHAAREEGFGLMVGNMGGTSLGMAAHLVIAQACRYVDLDAPLLCRSDRDPALRYDGALVHPPSVDLWG